MLRRTKIKDPITGFFFFVQAGGTEFSAYKWFEDQTGLTMPSVVSKVEERREGSFGSSNLMPYVGLIWLSEKCGGSTVVHEVGHAVTNVCRVLELNPVNADEFYSSYLGWLFKQVNIFLQGKSK